MKQRVTGLIWTVVREGPSKKAATEWMNPHGVEGLEETITGRDQSKCLMYEGGASWGV